MHELAITKSLMRSIREVIEQNELAQVTTVNVELGLLSTFKKEPLLHYFNELKVSQGALINAQLHIQEVKGGAKCLQCNEKFEINDLLLIQCPQCKSFEATIQKGKDVIIKNIQGT